jgi:hypothetical protein
MLGEYGEYEGNAPEGKSFELALDSMSCCDIFVSFLPVLLKCMRVRSEHLYRS